MAIPMSVAYQPSVYVVLLAYNNLGDTLECLQSVTDLAYSNAHTVLVDNGSTDDTAAQVRLLYPEVEIVRIENNRGVPGGFNLGITYALGRGAEYVFLLNNDTVLASNLLHELVNSAAVGRNRAVLMPKVVYYDAPSVVWSAGARYRALPPAIVFIGLGDDIARHDRERDIRYAPTCGLLIHRRAFEEVGLFDDGYLFYYDDWDFCDRVRAAGMTIRYVPTAVMRHKVSRTIRSRKETFWRTWGASCVRYYRRHGRPTVLDLPLHLGYILLRESVQGHGASLPFFLKGALEGFRRPLGLIPRYRPGDSTRAL